MIHIHHELRKFFILSFFSTIAVIKFAIVDIFTKWLAKSILVTKPGYTIQATSFLDFVYSWNKGISFSLFGKYEHANLVFSFISIGIIAYIWRLAIKAPNYRIYVGYTWILGGALGNLYDRLVNGAVFDFISFHFNGFYFPAFNLADFFISIGAIRIIYGHFKMGKAVAKDKEKEYNPIAAQAARIRKLDAEIAERGIKR